MNNLNDVTEFAKGNLEAFIASAKAAQAGAETLGSAMLETSRARFEETQNALQAMATVKSPMELMELQNNFTKSQIDHAVSGWSRMTEAFLKVSGEVVQPFSNRFSIAAETFRKPGVAA